LGEGEELVVEVSELSGCANIWAGFAAVLSLSSRIAGKFHSLAATFHKQTNYENTIVWN